MSIRRRWFGLAVVVASVWLPLGEAADHAAPRKSFGPGWAITRASRQPMRRLVAKPRQWKPQALADLQGLDSLDSLDLSGTEVADKDLEALTPLKSLKTLLLARTAISDAGMARLAGLGALETLDLSDTQVSDAGLPYLRGMKKLRTLVTHRSRVTEQGLAALESVRPNFEAVRLWDVTWEEFDHALLLRTPRFNLIQDFPFMPSGFQKSAQFQISGPAWKPRTRFVPGDENHKRRDTEGRKFTFRFACHVRPGDRAISAVTVGDTTLDISCPARTYLVDGHGKIRPADFSLRFDSPSRTWLEKPLKPAAPPDPMPESPSFESPPTASRSLADGQGPAPTVNYRVFGEWNGKLVWGYVDAERPHTGPMPLFSRLDLKYRSDAGVVIVFLHVPYMPVAYGGGFGVGGGFCGASDGCDGCSGRWDYRWPFPPTMQHQRRIEWFSSHGVVLAGYSEDRWYRPKDVSPEKRPFGSAYTVSVGGARGRGVYWAPFPRPTSPVPRWPEVAYKQWFETQVFDNWPDVRVEKRGTELVTRLGRDGTMKRAELLDWLGRTHVIESQRIDLAGPKKTIVLDAYGRLRVLGPDDARRILHTRLRDYLDNGDPSPAGPVTPVAATP
ncbi:MAG: hypothetical protein JW888_03200 [Pirellulales bacterium]|nr:hypothetical protein [Pirellulales bacterium]